MNLRVTILGAGFGGLELTSLLSQKAGDRIDITLIDKNDSFYFGFSKIDVMVGREPADQVKHYYSKIAKPGVKFRQEVVKAIDPGSKSVTTDKGAHEADVLVVALGADYDLGAISGLPESGYEFYTLSGAERLYRALRSFEKGSIVIGAASVPYKCPPAPSEAVLLLHDYLLARGVRGDCKLTLILPVPVPIPPSPDSSKALLSVFAERSISFVPGRTVRSLDASRRIVVLDDQTEVACDLFAGIPKHKAPDVVLQSGLTENGWVPVDKRTLMTKFEDVYAIGDVTSVGTPKAGVFAEGAARTVADSILAQLDGKEGFSPFAGAGSCFIEFGGGKIARVDIDFFSGPSPRGTHIEASTETVEEKKYFGSSRRARWFGIREE